MAKKENNCRRAKFVNDRNSGLKGLVSLPNDDIEPKLGGKGHIQLFNEAIVALKANKDFLKKLTEEANGQMSRTTFKISPK